MTSLRIIACLFLAYCSVPVDSSSEGVIFQEDYIDDDYSVYTGQHDIVKIFVLANKTTSEENQIAFFVEADVSNGGRTDQGLYVHKNGKVTKLLDNGRDAIATNENEVYIGASNGIYKYNKATNSVAKHGGVTDNIIQLAHNTVKNELYYLTNNHEVFKLNTEATAAVKLANIKEVQALVFGLDGSLYYYDSEKNVYVVNDTVNGVPKKIENVPPKMDKITLISRLSYYHRGGPLLLEHQWLRQLNSNATASLPFARLHMEPTAFGPEINSIQYYAKDKKLYKINLNDYLEAKADLELSS